MKHEILNELNLVEDHERECKLATGGLPESIWETYSSFANTNGGTILLGIREHRDSFTVEGLTDKQIVKYQKDFWSTLNDRNKVSKNILLNHHVRPVTVGEKKILRIDVPAADRHDKPVYIGTDPMKGTYKRDYEGDLASKHSDIDQKICDILHYIELCETNDEEAIDLIELLRVCRENRREIKDELQRIEYFQNNFGTSANAAKAKQALKCIKGLENRKYRPRKYEKLFENCILRDKDPSKAELRGMQIGYEDRKQKFSMEHTYTYEGGEETMFEERKETPYDGKENDWLAFAKQQAEFYKNAGQYITNLQLDIRELDDEIEAILLKAEDAHCNAAQGYKVFKRLRELRIEKKAKTKELNCLYALTDYMDCDALADTCEDNLAEIKGIMEVQEANDVTRIQPVENGEIQVVANIKDMVG